MTHDDIRADLVLCWRLLGWTTVGAGVLLPGWLVLAVLVAAAFGRWRAFGRARG